MIISLCVFFSGDPEFPVGHPDIVYGPDLKTENIHDMWGILHVRVLPPKRLHAPVLPRKMNDKLMFVLCRTCGEKMSTEPCTCADRDRAWDGK